MKKIYYYVFTLLPLISVFGQEVYLNLGHNFSAFDYTDSYGKKNENFNSKSSASYEIGYKFKLDQKFNLTTGITLDEYNAITGDLVNNYSWNSSYVGFQALVKYSVFELESSPLSLNLNSGINFNHIASGEQNINGQSFNLRDQNEFKGLFIKPIIGFDIQYVWYDDMIFCVGYNYSKNFGNSSNEEKLNFINSQIMFGISIALNLLNQ